MYSLRFLGMGMLGLPALARNFAMGGFPGLGYVPGPKYNSAAHVFFWSQPSGNFFARRPSAFCLDFDLQYKFLNSLRTPYEPLRYHGYGKGYYNAATKQLKFNDELEWNKINQAVKDVPARAKPYGPERPPVNLKIQHAANQTEIPQLGKPVTGFTEINASVVQPKNALSGNNRLSMPSAQNFFNASRSSAAQSAEKAQMEHKKNATYQQSDDPPDLPVDMGLGSSPAKDYSRKKLNKHGIPDYDRSTGSPDPDFSSFNKPGRR